MVQDLTRNSGTFIWKLTSFTKLLKSKNLYNEDVISPSFFTHERGYELQLEMRPEGKCEGKGSHISLYVRICSGPYDDMLRWPFNQDITVQVLDLTGDGRHHSDTISTKTGYPVSERRKPTTDFNNGYGWSSFVSHTHLETPSSRFLVDDTLYIRVIVS